VTADPSQPELGALLAPIAAAAALGEAAALERYLDEALRGGCPISAVREALLMLAPFGGFPRTLDALGHMSAVLRRTGHVDDDASSTRDPVETPARDGDRDDHATRGRALFDRVYGDDAERVLSRLLKLDPELPFWVLEDAYGRVLARPGLSPAQRERLAVVFLCALRLPNQLSGHVRGALRCGAGAADVECSLAAAEPLLAPEFVAGARRVLQRATTPGPKSD